MTKSIQKPSTYKQSTIIIWHVPPCFLKCQRSFFMGRIELGISVTRFAYDLLLQETWFFRKLLELCSVWKYSFWAKSSWQMIFFCSFNVLKLHSMIGTYGNIKLNNFHVSSSPRRTLNIPSGTIKFWNKKGSLMCL